MSRLYGFDKIGDLRWKESGCWHPSNVISIYRLVFELQKKRINFTYEIKTVSLDDVVNGKEVIYKEDENGTDISLFLKFENEADEAEFIMKENI